MATLGRTGLNVFPICLGGNVFGWTADEPQSQAVLDAYVEAGGNFIDTANSYLVKHGDSERIIGRWMADRGNRDQLVVATKVGGGKGAVRSLSAETIKSEAQASLERLQTDVIDIYYAHFDDEDTPLEESLRAFDELVQAGKVRHIAASNYSPERLTRGARAAEAEGARRVHGAAAALQPRRARVRAHDAAGRRRVGPRGAPLLLAGQGLPDRQVPAGRRGRRDPSAPRAPAPTWRDGGEAVLEALDEVAASHDTTVAAVALAWLLAHPRVVAPIASARTTEQLEQILPAATLELTPDEVDRLSATTRA